MHCLTCSCRWHIARWALTACVTKARAAVYRVLVEHLYRRVDVVACQCMAGGQPATRVVIQIPAPSGVGRCFIRWSQALTCVSSAGEVVGFSYPGRDSKVQMIVLSQLYMSYCLSSSFAAAHFCATGTLARCQQRSCQVAAVNRECFQHKLGRAPVCAASVECGNGVQCCCCVCEALPFVKLRGADVC